VYHSLISDILHFKTLSSILFLSGDFNARTGALDDICEINSTVGHNIGLQDLDLDDVNIIKKSVYIMWT